MKLAMKIDESGQISSNASTTNASSITSVQKSGRARTLIAASSMRRPSSGSKAWSLPSGISIRSRSPAAASAPGVRPRNVHQHPEAVAARPAIEGLASGVGHLFDLALERERRGAARADRARPDDILGPDGERHLRATRERGQRVRPVPIVTSPPGPTGSRSNTFIVPTNDATKSVAGWP